MKYLFIVFFSFLFVSCIHTPRFVYKVEKRYEAFPEIKTNYELNKEMKACVGCEMITIEKNVMLPAYVATQDFTPPVFWGHGDQNPVIHKNDIFYVYGEILSMGHISNYLIGSISSLDKYFK